MPTLQYIGEKEALLYCREQGLRIGIVTLRKWRRTVPGLYVVLPACRLGRYVRPVLAKVLATINPKQHQ